MRLPWSSTRVQGNGNGPSDADVSRKAITAGGERKNLADRTEAERYRKTRQDWQQDAIVYSRAVPEAKAALRYRAAMISKVRLLPAWVDEPGKLPVPLDAVDDDEQYVAPVPDSVRDLAFDTIARLDQSPNGLAGLLYELTYNLDAPGECHLIGLSRRQERVVAGQTMPGMEETWLIASVNELDVKDGGREGESMYVLKNAPKAVREGRVTEDDFMARMWQNDPFQSDLADSPIHGVLDTCEETMILQRAARAWALSRLNAGVLKVPNNLTTGAPDPTQAAAEGGDKHDLFKLMLFESMTTPIQQEGSASAVVPMTVFGEPDDLAAFQHMTLDRPIDKDLDARLELRVRRLARGLDAPPERVLGHQETTFANASQITIDEFRGYLEPTVMMECSMFTTAFFRPLLEAAGVTSELLRKLVVWYDASELVAEPDRTETAGQAHDRKAISDATYRRETGYQETDAPSDEELLRRLGLDRGAIDPPLTDLLIRLLDVALPPTDRPQQAMLASARSALVSAARPNVGRRLMEIDRALRARLESLADYHVKRALEKAGARVRAKVAAGIREQVKDEPNLLVAAALGRSVAAAAGLTEDELLESAFDDLHDEYDQRVRRAQRASLDVLARSGALDEDERAELEAQQDEDRQSSWAWFLASLLGLARTRLFDPTPAATPGEFDSLATVPPGVIREAVARAGGAKGLESRGGALTTAGGTQPAGGIGTGQLVQDTFARHGWQITGWEWVYGDPSSRQSNFQPHLDQDGREIKDWGSEDLSVGENTWLATTGLRPGDHLGCRCDLVPVYAEGAA